MLTIDMDCIKALHQSKQGSQFNECLGGRGEIFHNHCYYNQLISHEREEEVEDVSFKLFCIHTN